MIESEADQVSEESPTSRTKILWLVNHYANPIPLDGGRHYGLARELVSHHWETVVIMCSVTHPDGVQHFPAKKGWSCTTVEHGIQSLWIRSITHGRSLLRRAIGWMVFTLNLLRPAATRQLPRPDAVLGSTIHPLAAWAAWRLSRRHAVPFIFEIRDIWPETLIDLGNMAEGSLFAKGLRRINVMLAQRASLVVSPLPNIREYLNDIGCDHIPDLWISNGVNPGLVESVSPRPSVSSATGPFIFMYLGSFNLANSLAPLVAALDVASALRPKIDFRLSLVGDGPEEFALRELAESCQYGHQVSFEPRITRAQVIERAQKADCLVSLTKPLAVYRYGISPNKAYDYLLCGRPIIFSADAFNNPIKEAGAGLVVPPGDVGLVAQAMISLAETPLEDRICMGENGRTYVLKNATYAALATRLAEGLDHVVP